MPSVFNGQFDISWHSGGPTGPLLGRATIPNGVTYQGMNYLQLAGFSGQPVLAPIGVSAILDSGYTGVAATDTAAAHPGWADRDGSNGGIQPLALNPLIPAGAVVTLQPFDLGSSILLPNNTFVRGASLYLGLSTTSLGLQTNSGTVLFCTAAVAGTPLFLQDTLNPTGPFVFVRVGYTIRGLPVEL